MKAENIYLLPVKRAQKAAKRFFGMLLTAGLLLLTMPAMAQYYNVSHLSGTQTPAGSGVAVTVTNSNGSSFAGLCGYGPYKEGNAGPGSYTWTFGTAVVAIRTHIVAIGPADTVTIFVNGVAYPLSASQVNPLPAPCSGNTAIVSGGKIVTGGGNSDATVDINMGIATINNVTIQSAGPSGVVASDFNFEPILNQVPSFTAGNIASLSVCQDAAAKDISSTFSINDNDNAQTETWTVTSAPAHGSLGGFPHSATSNGGVVNVPAGTFTYQPTAGFNGADSFIIRINDGTDTADLLVRMTVNPTPNVTVSSSQTQCNGSATDSVYFLGTVAGTTFSWNNDDNSTGLAFNGNGNIPSFTATNTGFSPVVSTVTVTPTFMGCAGAPKIFTITVNPTPDVYIPTNATVCTGDLVTLAAFASDVAGVTYTWVNDNSNIGLATTGSGNSIAPFTAQNTTTSNNVGNISVTPTANGCSGIPQSFSVTVYPTPMLTSATANKTCDSADFHYVPTSATTGVTYAWDRAVVAGVANMVGSGLDSVDEHLDNTVTSIVPVIYTFTLTANGCANVQNVTDTVIPTLLLTSAHVAPSVCNNTVFSYTPMSPTSGVTFQWNRNPVYGISNNGATNSFNPLETLIDTLTTPVVVTYNYYVIYATCSNEQDIKVTVNPTPKLTTTHTPAAICDSTMFTYGSASSTAGTTYTWSRAVQLNISNNANSGVDTIKEVLVNTSANPVPVVYADTLTANGCKSVEYVTVYVNPKPVLSSNRTPAVCSGDVFNYVHASNTLGTTYSWSRAAVTGITNPAASDTGNIHETLINPDTAQHIAIYLDTLTINGCKNIDTIWATVNPIPKLKSTHTPAAICNKQIFTYAPASATTNTSFSWSRAYVLGIDALAGFGTDNPLEQLINTTHFDLTVAYVYTLTANGCQKTNDTVFARVHPTLSLSSPDSVVTCSHALFTYKPESYSAPVSFKWTRAQVQGVYPATAKDSGIVKEILVDTATFPIYTTYKYKLTIDNCTDSANLVVKVNPAPFTPQISIKTPDALCSNTHFQNFGALTAPPAGSTYNWTSVKGTVMATGNNRQNALVSFDTAGMAQVIVTSSLAVTGCRIADTFNVNVGTGVSDNPNVIYYNGQFMCLQNDVKTYQWGFDDVLSLDSTAYPGEINQVYFNSTPDYTYKYYWVMTTNGNGCMQKSYYNVPLGVVNVNATDASLKVYPNPTSSNINVEINAQVNGDVQVEILNLVGQRVSATTTADRRATINVSELATGCYLVNCYHDGVKIAATKFIKN